MGDNCDRPLQCSVSTGEFGRLKEASFGQLASAAQQHLPLTDVATTFFICGFTTNGLVGTHLIAFCSDHGIVEVQAASLLALMGFFDLFGTTFSGWLTDRFDPRKLLFFYYGLRGLALIYLPYSDFSLVGLSVFAVFYGLDWLATVPPTVRIANEAFGDKNAPLVFWLGGRWSSARRRLRRVLRRLRALRPGRLSAGLHDRRRDRHRRGRPVADDRPAASATGAPLPDSFSVMESGFRQQQRLGSTTSDSRRSRR